MNPSQKGKFFIHNHGTGGVSTGDLEQRARELAEIDGRENVTAQDRARARIELAGNDRAASTEDDEIHGGITRDPSEPASNYGHQTLTEEAPDEQPDAERLVNEGADEAQHEQMLAARRKDKKD